MFPSLNQLRAVIAFCLIACVGLVFLLLSGCSTNPPLRPALSEFSVRVGMGRMLTVHPEWIGPTMEITRIMIGSVPEGVMVPIEELETYVLTQTPWRNYYPNQSQILATTMVQIADVLTSTLAEQGVKNPERTPISVADILNWAYQAAEIRSVQRH